MNRTEPSPSDSIPWCCHQSCLLTILFRSITIRVFFTNLSVSPSIFITGLAILLIIFFIFVWQVKATDWPRCLRIEFQLEFQAFSASLFSRLFFFSLMRWSHRYQKNIDCLVLLDPTTIAPHHPRHFWLFCSSD